MSKKLSSDIVKYIALLMMLLDHIAWIYSSVFTPVGQIAHALGRITMPVMCYFLATGIEKTKDVKKYALRLLIAAIITQVPYCLCFGYKLYEMFNVMFTLLLSLIFIEVMKKDLDKSVKLLIYSVILLMSTYCDWSFFCIMMSVGFYRFVTSVKDIEEGEKRKRIFLILLFTTLLITAIPFFEILYKYDLKTAIYNCLYRLGILLSYPLIINISDKRPYKITKWISYIFYPLHLLILYLTQIH